MLRLAARRRVELPQPEVDEVVRHVGESFAKRLGARAEMHEDKTVPGIAAKLRQAMAVPVHGDQLVVGNGFQSSGQVVCPSVIGTGDVPRHVAESLVEQRRAPMPAGVRQSPQRSVGTPHNADGLAGQRHGEIVAGLGEFRRLAHEYPLVVENPLHLLGVYRFIRVRGERQGVGIRQRPDGLLPQRAQSIHALLLARFAAPADHLPILPIGAPVSGTARLPLHAHRPFSAARPARATTRARRRHPAGRL